MLANRNSQNIDFWAKYITSTRVKGLTVGGSRLGVIYPTNIYTSTWNRMCYGFTVLLCRRGMRTYCSQEDQEQWRKASSSVLFIVHTEYPQGMNLAGHKCISAITVSIYNYKQFTINWTLLSKRVVFAVLYTNSAVKKISQKEFQTV